MTIGRRRLILGTGGTLLVAAAGAHAQATRRIGVLIPFEESDLHAQARLKAFEQSLGKLGWRESKQLHIERRWAGGDPARIAAMSRDLVALAPDVILAHSTPAVAALQKLTRTIPIVFANLSDPVGSGFVSSLAAPGGNITGFINIESSLGGKWMELLKEIVPGLTHASILFNRATAPHADYYLVPFEAAAAALKVRAIAGSVRDPEGIAAVVEALRREEKSGLVVMPDTFTNVHRKLIIALAARHRLPTVYPYGYMASDGGLLSYGVDQVEMYRQAAVYVDRILRGEKPAALPVQLPTKFELIVNLKTAKALGLAIPNTVLIRADEVIE